ncbi:GMC family oxidoreductase N-terminal domain-containing protein [Paraburkholderia sediminicola]|nr:GMC family oxidoreductase N-terminal domain-containing protein [Paraburkholderia sediminicola]
MKKMTNSDEVFDYVIVGAGSAGCVLANRLSADPAVRVALIEAGGRDSSPWIHIPAGTRSVTGNPKTDWCFESEVEPMLGRKGPVLRGKVLGGSSSINGTVYIRGVPADYDHWRHLGLSGWGWDDVQPYFKRIERFADGGDDVRGGDGDLRIERPRIHMPIFDILDEAARQAGLGKRASFNRGEIEGYGMYDVTQSRGRRWSSSRAFLSPIKHRANLKILTECLCLGLTLAGRRVTGVRVRSRHGQQDRVIHARQEVVLAAGSIGSPHIMQLSGIGPAQALKAAGVEVVLDRPRLGENLQDHLSMRLSWKIHGVKSINTLYHSPIQRMLMGLQYLATRTGPLVMGAPLWGGCLRSDERRGAPNLQMFVMPATFTGSTSFRAPDRFDGVSCGIYNMHPLSRGRVWITSSDPACPPAILHNYLSDPDDQQVAVASIKLMRRLMNQPAFQALRPEEIRPDPSALSDAAILEAGKAGCGTAYHQVGTCAMGADDDSIVDERLRVRGIEALRIADGSVLPTLISGNTNSCIIMIGEKAADMILADARR